jgi:hypothetical protein
MKARHAAIIGLSAVTLVLVPFEMPAHAHGSGSGMHSFHFGKHFGARFRHAHHRNFNQWPWWYGGYYAAPPYDYDNNSGVAAPPNVVYVLGSPPVRSCQYIKETVTVPSESGGTRDITITRC